MTADRLKADAIPNSRTSRSMMRLPAEYNRIVRINLAVLGPRAQDFAHVAASKKITVEAVNCKKPVSVTLISDEEKRGMRARCYQKKLGCDRQVNNDG